MGRKTYEASCHCGAVRFEVTLDDALSPEGKSKVNRCNCSICTKHGYLLVYPKRGDVKFRDDAEEKLKSYFFGQKRKAHKFCSECSSNVLIDFADSAFEKERPYLAVNVRLFKEINLDGLEYTTFDGRGRLEPQYDA